MESVEVGEDKKIYAFTNEGDSLSSEIDSDSESSCNRDSSLKKVAPLYIPAEIAIGLPELDANDVFDFEKEKSDRLLSLKIATLAMSEQQNESDCIEVRKQLWKLWHTQIPQTHPRIVRSGNYIQDFWNKKIRTNQFSHKEINKNRSCNQLSSEIPERTSNLKQPSKSYKRLRKINGTQIRWSTGNSLESDTEDGEIFSQPIIQSAVMQNKSAWVSQKNKKRRQKLKSKNKTSTNGNKYPRKTSSSVEKGKHSIRSNQCSSSIPHSISREEQVSLLKNSISIAKKKTNIEEAHMTKSDSRNNAFSPSKIDKSRKNHDQKQKIENDGSGSDFESRANSSEEDTNDELEEFEENHEIVNSKILSSFPNQSILSSFSLKTKHNFQQNHSQHKPQLEFHTPHGTTDENKMMIAPKSMPTPKTKFSNSSTTSKNKRRKSFQHSQKYRRRLTQRTLDWN